MIRLDAITRKLQVVLSGAVMTNQLPVTVCYSDKTAADYAGATQLTNTNSTTAVDICAAPAAATVRDIDLINIVNTDTVTSTITVRYNDNATLYTLFMAVLAVGDQLTYVHGKGWEVLSSVGALKTGTSDVGASGGFKNKLINMTGGINQLALTSPVTLSAGQYGHDGFKGGSGGCTYSFVITANLTIFTITAGTLIQIANGKFMQSGPMTLGWNGTAQARIDGGGYAASPIASTAVGGTNKTIEWGTGTLSLPQYESGTVRTNADIRDDEISRCNQYFIKFGGAANYVIARGYNIAGGAYSTLLPFPVPMNSIPTMSTMGAALILANTLALTPKLTLESATLALVFIALGEAYAYFISADGYLTFSARL